MRERFGEALFLELSSERLTGARDASSANSSVPRCSLLRAAAYALASAVHLSSIVILSIGVWLLFQPWATFLFWFLGVLLILVAWSVRPQLGKLPHDALDRTQFPILYTIADRAAAKMNAPKIDAISISREFNAFYETVGFRRKRHMNLGITLLLAMNSAERVAVIAHELSHGANGDPLRGQFLHSAVHTLLSWAYFLRPASIGRGGEYSQAGAVTAVMMIPFEFAALVLSEFILWIAHALLLLVYRESQRAEYLADRLAASVAGSAASTSALHKILLSGRAQDAIRRIAVTYSDDDVALGIKRAMSDITPLDYERHRRISRKKLLAVDSTHPPTAFRIDMLAKQQFTPLALLDQAESDAMEREIMMLANKLRRGIIDDYLMEIT
jgi:Zn-dependent protease with chaperone function